MVVINGEMYESDEPRYFLEKDSICYGCPWYEEEGCNSEMPCIEGNLNTYRMEG